MKTHFSWIDNAYFFFFLINSRFKCTSHQNHHFRKQNPLTVLGMNKQKTNNKNTEFKLNAPFSAKFERRTHCRQHGGRRNAK